jgi:hypothetical protein
MTIEDHQLEVAEEANQIIRSASKCVTTGEGMLRHKTHVFLDHSNVCECGDVDLTKQRMN